MSSSRSEAKPVIFIDQKPIDADALVLRGAILSPSEYVRVYRSYTRDIRAISGSEFSYIRLDVVVRNIKDNWAIQLKTDNSIEAIALSPEGDLITAAFDKKDAMMKLTRWKNITSQNPEAEPIELKSHLSWVDCMAFKPTGELITAHEGKVFSWDLKSGIATSLAELDAIREIEIDKQGNLTLKQNVGSAQDIFCFDSDNKLIARIINMSDHANRAIRLSADRLALADPKQVIIWDVKKQMKIAVLDTDFVIQSLAAYGDGLLVVGRGFIKYFSPTSLSYQEAGTLELSCVNGEPRVFSNDFGCLSYVDFNQLIDFKFNPAEFVKVKKHLVDALVPSVNKDPGNIVLSYLFPRATQIRQLHSDPDSVDEVERKAVKPFSG